MKVELESNASNCLYFKHLYSCRCWQVEKTHLHHSKTKRSWYEKLLNLDQIKQFIVSVFCVFRKHGASEGISLSSALPAFSADNEWVYTVQKLRWFLSHVSEYKATSEAIHRGESDPKQVWTANKINLIRCQSNLWWMCVKLNSEACDSS